MQENHVKKYIDIGILMLVGLGGWCTAVFVPACIIIVGFLIPFADAATLTFLLKLIDTLWMKGILFCMMVLPIWYGLNCILDILESFSVSLRRGPLLFYGLAFVWSAHVGYVLFILEKTL